MVNIVRITNPITRYPKIGDLAPGTMFQYMNPLNDGNVYMIMEIAEIPQRRMLINLRTGIGYDVRPGTEVSTVNSVELQRV